LFVFAHAVMTLPSNNDLFEFVLGARVRDVIKGVDKVDTDALSKFIDAAKIVNDQFGNGRVLYDFVKSMDIELNIYEWNVVISKISASKRPMLYGEISAAMEIYDPRRLGAIALMVNNRTPTAYANFAAGSVLRNRHQDLDAFAEAVGLKQNRESMSLFGRSFKILIEENVFEFIGRAIKSNLWI